MEGRRISLQSVPSVSGRGRGVRVVIIDHCDAATARSTKFLLSPECQIANDPNSYILQVESGGVFFLVLGLLVHSWKEAARRSVPVRDMKPY
jgi:hypothetical protein